MARTHRPEDIVEFYDPTDVFGDLADALAEAFPGSHRRWRTRRRSAEGDRVRATRPGRRATAGTTAHDGPAADRPGRPVRLAGRARGAPGARARHWLQAWHAPGVVSGARAGQYVHVRTTEAGGLPLRGPYPIATADAATGTLTILAGREPDGRRAIRVGRPCGPWRDRSGGRSRWIPGRGTCC